MPRISDLPLTSSVDEATALVAVSSGGTTYKITPANLLASSGVGVSFYDSDSSHLITLAGGSNLSANRTLTLTTGDSNRTLDISAGDVTISSFAITILDDANAAAVRTTLGLGTMALETATDYLTVASAVSGYQPLDADLTTLAASITAFGHSLVDDANAAAVRTTLGLGTAATQNTGTSGATIPLLNAANTFQQDIESFSLTLTSAYDSANVGPNLLVNRYSATPIANDYIGSFAWRCNNSTPTGVNAAQLNCQIVDPTAGSVDIKFNFLTHTGGGGVTTKAYVQDGFVVGSPTGADKGVGAINAVAVYDDSVLLCAPVEFLKSGTVNTAMWDGFAIDVVRESETQEEVVEVEITLDQPETKVVGQRDGTYKKVVVTTARVPVFDEKPVLNDRGEVVDTVKVPRVTRKVIPAKTITRRNELAHEFKAMLDEGFDPRDPKAYFDKMLADEALPGLKTKANWVPNEESNAKRTNRIILALELQTAAFKTVYEQVEALKAEVAALKKARV